MSETGVLVVTCALALAAASCVESGKLGASSPTASARPTAAEIAPSAAPTRPAQDATVKALEGMIASERAFARLAQDRNIREAFITYLLDDAITFSPAPEKGRASWQKRKEPPAREPGKLPPVSLLWAPVSGDASIAGDMGYSTGPFVVRDNSGKRPEDHGLFFSVWKKQPDGQWRVALDIGVPTPERAYALDAEFHRAPSAARPPARGGGGGAREELTRMEAEASAMSAAGKTTEAFRVYFAEASRLHRHGRMPLTTRDTIVAYAEENVARHVTLPEFADVASSGDLGYTYGSCEITAKGQPGQPERGHYARVWQTQTDGGWKIVADIALPPKPAEK
jgi:ketosteroid isomerase-like protein